MKGILRGTNWGKVRIGRACYKTVTRSLTLKKILFSMFLSFPIIVWEDRLLISFSDIGTVLYKADDIIEFWTTEKSVTLVHLI